MAIGTYTELKSAVENWLDHQLFTARVPEFIALFEATANRRLKTRFQETFTTITTTDSSVALPTDFLEMRHVTWLGTPRVELEYVSPDYLQAAYPTLSAGVPLVYTIEIGFFGTRPVDDTTSIRLTYYKKIAALSDSAPTNWLLTSHPDVYLFGAMVEAEMFGLNDERMPLWKARRDEIFNEIEVLSRRAPSVGAMRIMAATP